MIAGTLVLFGAVAIVFAVLWCRAVDDLRTTERLLKSEQEWAQLETARADRACRRVETLTQTMAVPVRRPRRGGGDG